MAAYIDHAAYYTAQLDWHLDFFREVFGMEPEKSRCNPDGLREVWLLGGIQLCETAETQPADGRCAHLSLIVEDLEGSREKALSLGCAPMEKHHWVRLPEGLAIEMFQAADTAIEALTAIKKRK